VSPVSAASNPQYILQAFAINFCNHAGSAVAPEVDMAVYSGYSTAQDRMLHQWLIRREVF